MFQLRGLGQNHQWDVFTSEGVQILHQSTNHWVCVSTIGCPPNTAYLYDSMLCSKSRLPVKTTKDIASLLHVSSDVIDIRVPQSRIQQGSNDCGLFALATATSLCYGIPPCKVLWEQSKMRSHLKSCFQSSKMTPFPGSQKEATPTGSEEPLLMAVKVNVYCSCRMPQVGRERMAQCSKCHEWYHERCEDIPKTVFCRNRNKILFYCKYC